MRDLKNHTVVFYSHGAGAWAEFECGKCLVDGDFFDFDLQDLIAQVDGSIPKPCLNCGHAAVVLDRTPFNYMESN